MVSNEIIIAALLKYGTMKEAAEAAGVAPRTIYDRMQDKDFCAEYAEARNDVLRTAVSSIDGKLSSAIDAVSDIMNDKNTNPAIRLQAAQTIINNAGKFSDLLHRYEYRSRNMAKDPFNF